MGKVRFMATYEKVYRESIKKNKRGTNGASVTDAVREKFSVYSKTKIPWNRGKRIFNNLVKIIGIGKVA